MTGFDEERPRSHGSAPESGGSRAGDSRSALFSPRTRADSDADRVRVALVVPVLDEEDSLPRVLAAVPRDVIGRIVVADNGSTDRSAEIARAAGATVVREPRRGYGSACLAGLRAVGQAEVVAFVDGDYSDYPEDLRAVVAPVVEGRADLVVGTRTTTAEARRAMLPQARFGNWLAGRLMRLLFGIHCTDLGPMRAIRHDALRRLGMQDPDFGWTVEMQLRAHLAGLRVLEVPVRYRRRVGASKITGTLRGTVFAGTKILRTIFGYRLRPPRL